jgi:glutamate racemase
VAGAAGADGARGIETPSRFPTERPHGPPTTRPIGVFDSGVGGLTVLRALRAKLPHEDFLYLGDTARLPYGTKSAATVARYSVQCAGLLVARGIDALVVACNTASAFALPALAEAFPGLPIVGVIEPGAAAAVTATRTGRIAVIATEGTVRGGAYAAAIARRRADAQVTSIACPLFVALAEEGWVDGPIVEAAAHRYLDATFASAERPDTLVLGCTHFPVFAATLRAVLGADVSIVDSAATTADAVAALLGTRTRTTTAAGSLKVMATDGPERFARVSAVFGIPVDAVDVELVDLAIAATR